MVESALFFLVGFLSAALLAVLATPAVARRAMRLATARARLQSPLSEAQARAERDALRGQHAVEIVRLEKRVAAAEWDRAVAKTDLGRETRRMLELDALARARAADLDAQTVQVAALADAVDALEAETGAREVALWDLMGQRDAAIAATLQARAAILDLETQIDDNRTVVATLSTQISGLEVELADWRKANGGSPVPTALEGLGDLEQRLHRSERTRENLTLEVARQLKTMAEREAALAAAEAAARHAKHVEAALRVQLHASTTAHAAAEGALRTERAARAESQREAEMLRERLAEAQAASEAMSRGDSALRVAIARLGREVTKGRASNDDEPHGAAQVVNFTRREPVALVVAAAELAPVETRDGQPFAKGG